MKAARSLFHGARSFGGALAFAIATGVLGGCASVKSTISPYAGATHYSATDPVNVVILRTEPTRPFDRIGEIALDAATNPAAPNTEVEERMRKDAAKMGADAVVVMLDRTEPDRMHVQGAPYDRIIDIAGERKLIGVAIKYR